MNMEDMDQHDITVHKDGGTFSAESCAFHRFVRKSGAGSHRSGAGPALSHTSTYSSRVAYPLVNCSPDISIVSVAVDLRPRAVAEPMLILHSRTTS